MSRMTKAMLETQNTQLVIQCAQHQQEIRELKAELAARSRERSRTPPRVQPHFEAKPLSAAGYRALEIVCKHDRDPVIEEQRATIARLPNEHAREIAWKDAQIEDYRIGNGQIAPVLLAAHRMSDLGVHIRNQTVAEYVRAMYVKYNNIGAELLFGVRR